MVRGGGYTVSECLEPLYAGSPRGQQEALDICRDDCCWPGLFWNWCFKELWVVRGLHHGGLHVPEETLNSKSSASKPEWGLFMSIWKVNDTKPELLGTWMLLMFGEERERSSSPTTQFPGLNMVEGASCLGAVLSLRHREPCSNAWHHEKLNLWWYFEG